jgi:hypothetical protein
MISILKQKNADLIEEKLKLELKVSSLTNRTENYSKIS